MRIDLQNTARLKSKFFLTRFVGYFSFLLIPVWIQKTMDLNRFFQTLITVFYCLFMFGQWYLMAKEIDHRLRIYFKTSSSIDRIVYRLVIGGAFFILLFNMLSLVPESLFRHVFWGIWVVIGLYYSWPTRGKIIEESMTGQLVEFRYLDIFEKSVLFVFGVLFFVTIPELPRFENIEVMKLAYDPHERVHNFLWTFIEILFFPFYKNTKLYSLSWSLFFYLWGGALYFLSLYSLMRLLFSRRIAILGLFALVSTWSVSKIVNNNYSSILVTGLPLMWVWANMWSWRSSTYRSGLLVGVSCFTLFLINGAYIVLYPLSLILGYLLLSKNRTNWYRNQMAKYSFFGGGMVIISLFFSQSIHIKLSLDMLGVWWMHLTEYLDQKAFYVLSILGILIALTYLLKLNKMLYKSYKVDDSVLKELFIFIAVLFGIQLMTGVNAAVEFSMLWWLALFSLIPVELIFQSISKLRSKRNLIYFVYVLICLLDSHFEGRVKIILRFFS